MYYDSSTERLHLLLFWVESPCFIAFSLQRVCNAELKESVIDNKRHYELFLSHYIVTLVSHIITRFIACKQDSEQAKHCWESIGLMQPLTTHFHSRIKWEQRSDLFHDPWRKDFPGCTVIWSGLLLEQVSTL